MSQLAVALLTLAVLVTPLAVKAQPVGKVYRIGFLGSGSATGDPRTREAFREGLREFGWVEGQNLVIEYRFAEGRSDRLSDLAAELVRLKVDVIAGGRHPPFWPPRRPPGRSPSSG